MFNRSNGILLHISSLPGAYGIGDFGKEAYRFADFLEKSGVNNWQVLPLGITGYGDSPYQSFSAFAGNPYFIDIDDFLLNGYVSKEDVKKANFSSSHDKIDYAHLYKEKMNLLRIAYNRSKNELEDEMNSFFEKEKDWLREFALYMAIKKHHNQKSWLEWEDHYRKWDSQEVSDFEKNHQDEIGFWVFTQYYFEQHWMKLKKYANDKGIEIIGDLPIYVSIDSSDVWRNPELFRLDKNRKPVTVAGCPPDAFSETGQLWGNPIYNWDNMKSNDYKWWLRRIAHSFKLYDVLRIDHFRGFEAYWEIPYGDETAVAGEWSKGPGYDLFKRIKEELGELKIISEDLGFLTQEVKDLREDTGYPGIKVLQFAFDPKEESDYLPHNYDKNSVVYTGTHDNHTVLGWTKNIPKAELEHAKKYLKLDKNEGYAWGMIRGTWASVSNLAIAPIQDFLGLGDEARMNIPSTLGGNWDWRLDKGQMTDSLSSKIKNLNHTYRRL